MQDCMPWLEILEPELVVVFARIKFSVLDLSLIFVECEHAQ